MMAFRFQRLVRSRRPSRLSRLGRIFAAASIAWAGGLIASVLGGGAPAQHETSDVFISGIDGYHTYRIPSLLVSRRGTLLAFCEGRKDDRRDHGDIDLLIKRSSDGGRTWSKSQIVYEEGGTAKITIGNPCPVIDAATGTIWLSFCRNNSDVLMTKSADDGVTWSAPADITQRVKRPGWDWYATGPGVGIQLTRGPARGRLVIPCDHREEVNGESVMHSHVFYSDDSGATWSLGGSAGPHTNECQVVELADGSLMLNMRNYWGRAGNRRDRDAMRAVSISADGGETWGAIAFDATLIEPVCQASFIRHSWPGPGSRSSLLFSNPASASDRRGLTVRMSYDEGKTWPVSRVLHPGPAAYSCLATLADGRIACLYEAGEKHAYEKIVCARFTLEWLTGESSAGGSGLLFDVADHGDPGDRAPAVKEWKRIPLDPEYAGHWIVTGDVDGDGSADIVSARNVDLNDVHYTSAAVAHRLDGAVIWRWGDPAVGRRELHHDVACQIYDWDGDGRNEVILCAKGFLVELDGATGRERRRIPIPPEATDCIVFAALSGGPRATDVLVKTRYTQIWAYDREGKLLWTVENPGGFRTAHQPRPIDLDGDGRDEIMAGYAMLNHDGSVRWKYASSAVNQERGHLDCCRVLRSGKTPAEFRLVLTCCGANNTACIDGNGSVIWEVPGHHFESIQVGSILPDAPHPQILVDIDHRPYGQSPLWVLDAEGRLCGRITSDYCRDHGLLEWTGDGLQEIVIAHARGVFDRRGVRIATFDTGAPGENLLLGDMTGDGISDVTILTAKPFAVHVFKNERGTEKAPLGCGANFTLY